MVKYFGQPENKYKLVYYTPRLRVVKFENEYYVEMEVIPIAMPSNQIGYNWKPIPNFKLYKNHDDAVKKMDELIKSKFELSVESICLGIFI